MRVSQRIKAAIRQKEGQVLPLFTDVASIKKHVEDREEDDSTLPSSFSVELCVLSIDEFKRGWRCVLIDKEASDGDFNDLLKDFNQLTYREQGEYIFRLTIWRGRKHPTRKPSVAPGSLLFVKEVSDAKLYSNVCQGTADADDLLKHEGEQSSPRTENSAHIEESKVPDEQEPSQSSPLKRKRHS